MKFDASIQTHDLDRLAMLVQAAEAIGFDALWFCETRHEE